jgi:hypothetical protein
MAAFTVRQILGLVPLADTYRGHTVPAPGDSIV